MGRTDEVQFLLECAKAWQSRGARVTWQAGWESRGNGYEGNYEGCLVHHTAFISSASNPNPALSTLINGRPDLSGPLCNVTGPWCADADPRLHVVAAYPANHAGASGGRSMGPLPVTSLFNPRVLGLEIDYAGLTPMTGGQYRGALIFARGVCDVLGRSTEYARAHAETSITGKWDPGWASGQTIDMAAFRRDAATITSSSLSGSTEDADMKIIQASGRGIALVGAGYYRPLATNEEVNAASKAWGAPVVGSDREFDLWVDLSIGGKSADTKRLVDFMGLADPDANGQDRLGDLWNQAAGNHTAVLQAIAAAPQLQGTELQAAIMKALAEGTVNVKVDVVRSPAA